MKKIKLVLLISVFVFSAVFTVAAQEKKGTVPVGMEEKEIEGRKFIVPIGARFQKRGDLLVLESAHEYVARRLYEMEECLKEIETTQQELGKKIEEVKQTMINEYVRRDEYKSEMGIREVK